MEERIRVTREGDGGGGGGLGDIFTPLTGGPVTVVNGPYAEQLPAGGMTVGDIRRRYHDRFDIDPESLAVLDGDVVGDDAVVQVGQLLRFSRKAGEKGSALDLEFVELAERLFSRPSPGGPPATVEIAGPTVTVTSPEQERRTMPIDEVIGRLAPPRMSTEGVVLPDGVKAVISRGRVTIWIHQTPPGVHNLRWIAEDSETPYGPGTTYREVKIALPYVVVLAVFQRDPRGRLQLAHANECFFRNEPLRSLDDELLYPALLNCSKHENPEGRPLAWICTQHMNVGALAKEQDGNRRLRSGMDTLLHCLFDAGFNYSSEHHEGASWYTASRELDERIGTVEGWEEATREDPFFATGIPWHPTGHTVREVAERILAHMAPGRGRARTASDIARVVLNHGAAEEEPAQREAS